MIRVGGYCADWDNKAVEHCSLFKSLHFIHCYK